MSDPKEPAKPSRLIIPGAEREPAEQPRIILPPGTSVEAHDDLPEYPRLRAVQLTPVRDGERELLLVTDPLGVTPGQPVLGLETIAILQLLDGATSLADIQSLVMRESKDLRVGHIVREFIAKLDDLFLLHSPRFEAALARMQEEWHPLEVRPAALEGISYPGDREPLEAFLDEHYASAERRVASEAEPAPAAAALPRALLAPHLDPRRAGPVLARAYVEIGAGAAEAPLRVVVFGTGHQLGDAYVALTRKRFETPLGQVPCDTAFVDHVAARLGAEAYRREIVHRDEHSIEFQILYLERRLRGRRFTLVPILCGGFDRLLDDRRRPTQEPVIETLVAAVREAEERFGGPTLYVAGVDFSHVGPRFGDPPLHPEVAEIVRRTDEQAIRAAASGDGEAWFETIAEADDATRICGFAPTYCMLRAAAPGAGRSLQYEQSAEPDGSVVTVAAMAWP
ncbi:MAG: AmmeMemoRadiSam system protein B [Deltaproteobacteria bacterium]|nr:MAG: AmmeMemoRadiSam system protein B [Deltaproteobacteria bacterium]